MPRIIVDFDPEWPEAPPFSGDTSDLVYFLSWAFSARYGASHEMAVASMVLRGEFDIDLKPLLTFADRDVEMEADADMMERAWQDAAPLAETCVQVVRALEGTDPKLDELRGGYPALKGHIDELGKIAGEAAYYGRRLRVTFELE